MTMNILEKQSPNHHSTTTSTTAPSTPSSTPSASNNSNNGGGGTPVGCSSAPPSAGSLTPQPNDLISNNNNTNNSNTSQLILPQPSSSSSSSTSSSSLSVPPASTTAPSSSSVSSAPHTPLGGLQALVNNCLTPDLTSSSSSSNGGLGGGGGSGRPSVSTPSSVFNHSAPNTPCSIPCGVGPDTGGIQSPIINQLGDYVSTPQQQQQPPPSSHSPFSSNNNNNANSSNNNNSSAICLMPSQSPLNCIGGLVPNSSIVPSPRTPLSSSDNLTGGGGNNSGKCNSNTNIGNGGSNKKHCNNRNNNNNNNVVGGGGYNNSISCGSFGVPMGGGGDNNNKNQITPFSMTPPLHSGQIPSPMGQMCMQQNGPSHHQVNGSISPFDMDCKMTGFPDQFNNPSMLDGPGCSGQPSMMSPHNSCGGGSVMGPRIPSANMNSIPPHGMIPPPPPPQLHPHQQPMPPVMTPGPGNKMMCNQPQIPQNMKQQPMPPIMVDGQQQQYMQQHQSKIHVFTTEMANQAAQAFDQGHYTSIIDFHMAQPKTKIFLEKNPMKMHLHSFHNPHHHPPNHHHQAWMGSGNNVRPTGRMRGPNPNGMMRGGVAGNNHHQSAPSFNQTPSCFSPSPYNHGPPDSGPPGGGGGPPSSGPGWNHPGNNWPPGNNPSSMPPNGPSGGGGFPLMNDMKMGNFHSNNNVRQPLCGPQQQYNNFNNPQTYPIGANDTQDDNLTPQQKQHREKQLAKLANLQQQFLPELVEQSNQRPPPQSMPTQANDFCGPMVDPIFSDSMPPIKSESDSMSDFGGPPNYGGPNMMMNDPWVPPSKSSTPGFSPEETKPFINGGGGGRRKGSLNNHQSSVNSPNPGTGNRVPPPPYNQSLHRSLSSPHHPPASPAASLSSMSSPRMASNEGRGGPYTSGSAGHRSGPSTPLTEMSGGPSLMSNNSPKPTTMSGRGKKNKQQQQQQQQQQQLSLIDNDLSLLNSFTSKASEPALMPVPSPKQIDYINTFEAQELTIQKQPNAHFQETNDLMVGNGDICSLNNDLFSNEFGGGGGGGGGGGIGGMCSNNIPPQMNPNSRFSSQQPPCNFDSRYPNNMSRFHNGGPPLPPPMSMDSYRPPPNMCGGNSQSMNEPNMRFQNNNCDMKRMGSGPSMSNDIGPPFPPNNNPSICELNNFNNSIPSMNDASSFNGPSNHLGFNDQPGMRLMDDGPMSSPLQNLQKMAFDVPGSNSKSMGPGVNMPSNPNAKNSRMHGGQFDQQQQRGPFGPPPPPGSMKSMAPPCNDLNEPFDGSMSPMPNYPNNFSSSPRMPSNLPPNDTQYGPGNGGMHSNFSLMPMGPNGPPPHSMMYQNTPNGPNQMSMMPPGNNSMMNNFGPRFPPNRPSLPLNNGSSGSGPRYNSPNIQVKPDAPNTIQYLPSRPQGPTATATPPNRPNLDFLQQSLSGNKPSSRDRPPCASCPPPPPNANSNYYSSSSPCSHPMSHPANRLPNANNNHSGPNGHNMNFGLPPNMYCN